MLSIGTTFFLQSGSVMDRIGGVQGRFSDDGAANQQFMVPILITLGCGLLALFGYRAWQWLKFREVVGPKGAGLERRLITPLWRAIDRDTQLDPTRLLNSRELTAVLLESLAGRDQGALQRGLLSHFIARHENLRKPLPGVENLAQLERLRLRRADGMVLEGFVRRVGRHAIDFVALETPMQILAPDEMLEMERANGDRIEARVLRISGLHGPWTLGVGDTAVYGHRREEPRVALEFEGLIFETNPRLEKIRQQILDPEVPTHHLVAKARARNPDSFESLLADALQFRLAEVFAFDDLNALGARIRIREPKMPIEVDRNVYLYLPLEIDGRRQDHFVSAEIVEVWTQSLDGSARDHVVRCRFFDISDKEARDLRILVNQVSSAKDRCTSLARDLLTQYVRQPGPIRTA